MSLFSNSPELNSTGAGCLTNHMCVRSASAAMTRMYQMMWLAGPFSPRLLCEPVPEGLGSGPDELPLSELGMSKLYVPEPGRSTPWTLVAGRKNPLHPVERHAIAPH